MHAAQRGTKTIPIVAVTDDMVGTGLVSSLARPDGNTTGISILAGELDGKRQSTLTQAKARALQDAARARNVDLSIYPITKGGEEIAMAIDKAQAWGAKALNVLASPMLYANGGLIMERVAALRFPAMYQWPEMAEEGGFAAYGPRLNQLLVLAARLVANLLRGIKPADLPIEQPTQFELVINLKTADAVGVTVPHGRQWQRYDLCRPR